MKTIKVLIVDNLSIVREGIKHIVKKDNDIIIVGEAKSCEEAIKYLDEHPGDVDVLMIDTILLDICSVGISEALLNKKNSFEMLVFTQKDDEFSIISTIKLGALGYITKEEMDELIPAIREVAIGNRYFSHKVRVKMMNSFIGEHPHPLKKLSIREKEIIKHIADGETNIRVGKVLGISSRTVETHRRNILGKMGVKNTAEMIKYAMNNRIIA